MRVELRDGQWAELRERITHGQDKEITRARVVAKDDPENHANDDTTVALRIFITAWSMNDPDGKAINLTDADAIERMPSDIADELLEPIVNVLVPKGHSPKPAYSFLIGRLNDPNSRVMEREIDRLPEPDLFRDAALLAGTVRWSPQELDDTDALLLALILKFRNVRRG